MISTSGMIMSCSSTSTNIRLRPGQRKRAKAYPARVDSVNWTTMISVTSRNVLRK